VAPCGDVNFLTPKSKCDKVLPTIAHIRRRLAILKAVDLFSGCGGLSLGFQLEDFDVVAAFEWWDAAIKCYEAIFSHPVLKYDLTKTDEAIEEIRKYSPDIIIGGPPCQDFSHAGKRIEAGRAELTECFAKIVVGYSPKCFVMENVDRARNSNAYAIAREY